MKTTWREKCGVQGQNIKTKWGGKHMKSRCPWLGANVLVLNCGSWTLSILYEVCCGYTGSSSFLSLPSNPEPHLLLKSAPWWVCELRGRRISVLWTDCWHRGTGQSLLLQNSWFPVCSLNLSETQPWIAPWPCLFDQEAVYSESKSGTLTLCLASAGTNKQQCVPFQGYTSSLLSVLSFWPDVLESEKPPHHQSLKENKTENRNIGQEEPWQGKLFGSCWGNVNKSLSYEFRSHLPEGGQVLHSRWAMHPWPHWISKECGVCMLHH